jgi:hypothetical protein
LTFGSDVERDRAAGWKQLAALLALGVGDGLFATIHRSRGGPAAVRAVSGAKNTRFSGRAFCDWPGGTALGIYWAASWRDVDTLDPIEVRLRCDDDPVLLAQPTPWTRVMACMHG